MIIPLQVTQAKLQHVNFTTRAMDGESIPIVDYNPIVVPNASQFPGYQQGVRKYFRVTLDIRAVEIEQNEYDQMGVIPEP